MEKRVCAYCNKEITNDSGIHVCLSSQEYREKITQRNKQIKHLKNSLTAKDAEIGFIKMRIKELESKLYYIRCWDREVISDKDKLDKIREYAKD